MSKIFNGKNIARVISTVGSAGIGVAYSAKFGDPTMSIMGGFVGGFVGGLVVFVVIPTLVRIGLLAVALLIGLVMSATWIGNADLILSIMKQSQYSIIDSRYKIAKEKYTNATVGNVYISPTKLSHQSEIERLKSEIERLKSEISISSPIYRNIKDEIETGFKLRKAQNKKLWASTYKKDAKNNGCRTKINFHALVNCVSQNKFKLINIKKRETIQADTIALEKAQNLLSTEIAKEQNTKINANNDKAKVQKYKKIVDSVEAEADKRAKEIEPTIIIVMWILGLIAEVLTVMWSEMIAWFENKKKKEKVVNDIEEIANQKREEIDRELSVKEEKIKALDMDLEKVEEKKIAVTHNYKLMKYLVGFANGDEDAFKNSLRVKYKSRTKRGEVLALANAIVGAFLFSQTIKKNQISIQSYRDITQSDILFVNGFDGKTKNQRMLNEHYISNVNEEPVNCLGSTAQILKNKDVLLYLKNEGENRRHIIPQQEALEYLIMKEKIDFDRYNPIDISIKDFQLLVMLFVGKYYPQQF